MNTAHKIEQNGDEMSHEDKRQKFYDTFERVNAHEAANQRDIDERKRMSVAGPGKEGEDVSLRKLSKAEIGPAFGQPGYDPSLNSETQKRVYASKFHKNIYSRWNNDKKKHLKTAADAYLAYLEDSQGGFSFNAYEDAPPPDHYTPKVFPNKRRIQASQWIADAHKFVGSRYADIIKKAIVQHMTLAMIHASLNPFGKKSKRTAYRKGGGLVDAAFDRLSEFVNSA